MKQSLNKKTKLKSRRRVPTSNGGAAASRTRWTPVPSNSPFVDETLEFWQPRYRQTLTREDAREIIENVTGFLSILQEWDMAERLALRKRKRSDNTQQVIDAGETNEN